jgi:hypothetical protein
MAASRAATKAFAACLPESLVREDAVAAVTWSYFGDTPSQLPLRRSQGPQARTGLIFDRGSEQAAEQAQDAAEHAFEQADDAGQQAADGG